MSEKANDKPIDSLRVLVDESQDPNAEYQSGLVLSRAKRSESANPNQISPNVKTPTQKNLTLSGSGADATSVHVNPIEHMALDDDDIVNDADLKTYSPHQEMQDRFSSPTTPTPLRRTLSTPVREKVLSPPTNRAFSPRHAVTSLNRPRKMVQWDKKHDMTTREPSDFLQSPKAVHAPVPLRRHNSLPARATYFVPPLHLSRTHSSSSLSSNHSANEETIRLTNRPSTDQEDQMKIFRSRGRNSRRSMEQDSPDIVQFLRLSNTDSLNEEDSDSSTTESDKVNLDRGLFVEPLSPSLGGNQRKLGFSVADDSLNDGVKAKENSSPIGDRTLLSFLLRRHYKYLIYVSSFAMFGSIIRIYVGRLFGLDCEFNKAVNDFWSHFASKICITASGRTMQRGGALFIDLPANMLGSFVMGLLTSLKPNIWPPLPWLPNDHPLQANDALHVGFQTGMCGSITSFASWNSQMVVMMDGTATELGVQVAPALFGYLVGLYCSVASFLFGTHVSTWLNRRKSPETINDTDSNAMNNATLYAIENGERRSTLVTRSSTRSESGANSSRSVRLTQSNAPFHEVPPTRIVVYPAVRQLCGNRFCLWIGTVVNWQTIPLLVMACLLMLFIVADTVWGIRFYRTLWLTTLFTPFGAILRWSLAKWNYTSFRSRLAWAPWGTLAANLLGSFLSLLFLGLETRHCSAGDTRWSCTCLSALKLGFAGSLSTVSTFVKEIVDLASHYPQCARPYYYSFGTICAAMLLGFCVYTPLVRIG